MPQVSRTGWLWVRGRFSWPFVVTVAYLAAALFLFDLVWRTAKMPIEELLAFSAAAFALSSIVLAVAIRILARRASGS